MADILPIREASAFFGTLIPVRRLQYWIKRGIVAKHGGRVKLRSIWVGGRRYIQKDDVEEFLAALSDAGPRMAPKPTRREEAAEKRRREQVRDRLREQWGMTL